MQITPEINTAMLVAERYATANGEALNAIMALSELRTSIKTFSLATPDQIAAIEAAIETSMQIDKQTRSRAAIEYIQQHEPV